MTPDLERLLADPSHAAAVPVGDVPALLEVLEGLRARLWARLMQPVAVGRADTDGADVLLGVEEAAAFAKRSVSWMRKHGHTVPGFHQPGGRGRRARWSRRALRAWAYPEVSC